MRGKQSYVQAVYNLGQYIATTSPEVIELEKQLEVQFLASGLVDSVLEDRMFAKKAEALEQIILELESGAKYLPAREIQ